MSEGERALSAVSHNRPIAKIPLIGFGSAVEYFQANPSKTAWISLVSFVQFETFQRVVTQKIRKLALLSLRRRVSPKARVRSRDWAKVARILIFGKQLDAIAVRVPASTIPSGRVMLWKSAISLISTPSPVRQDLVLGEGRERDNAAAFDFKPQAPVRNQSISSLSADGA